MDLDPSPNAGVYCYSVRVSVIVKTCNTHRISNLLWSEFLIITQTRFWKKSRFKLIYPITARYIFLAAQKFPIHKSKFREICKKWDCPLFHMYIFFHPKIQISACFGKNDLGPQPAAYPFMTACVFGLSIRQ